MRWSDRAHDAIEAIDAALPADATFKQRVAALRDGYPFGQRSGWAYKAWLAERRKYLAKHVPPDHDSKRFPLSPLERAIARTGGKDAQP